MPRRRRVGFQPHAPWFSGTIDLTGIALEEIGAIRLEDLKDQKARSMSQPTFHRVLESARRKAKRFDEIFKELKWTQEAEV